MTPTPHSTRVDARRARRLGILMNAALILSFLGAALTLGFGLYSRALVDAKSLATALNQYALRTVTVGNVLSASVRTAVLQRGGLEGVSTDRAMQEVLQDAAAQLPDGSGIILVDAEGRVVLNDSVFPAEPIDLSDRAWFKAHRDTGVERVLNEALHSRVSKRKMFILTLAIRDEAGGFLGAVNMGLPSDSLIALPEYAPGAVLTLVKADGSLLARSSFPDALLGSKLMPGATLDAPALVWGREVDGRVAIEAAVREAGSDLIATASIPLAAVLRPLTVFLLFGLPVLLAVVAAVEGFSRSLARRHRELVRTTARLQAVIDASHLGSWHWQISTDQTEVNQRWAEMLGHDLREIGANKSIWVERLHPAERDRVLAAVEDVIAGRAPYLHVEHRLRHKDGHWVWVLDSGAVVERDAEGRALALTGTHLDISERRAAEEKIKVLMREVDHRAKNLVAVIYSIANLTVADSVEAFKRTILGRIQAIGHVHSLLSEAGWRAVELTELVARELRPYGAEPGGALVVAGPIVHLRPPAAQAMGIVLHELATNSCKYGALSVPGGSVTLDWRLNGTGEAPGSPDTHLPLQVTWTETGAGPARSPERAGFGLTLLRAMLQDQLDGRIDFDWTESGLVCRMSIAASALAPPGAETAPGD